MIALFGERLTKQFLSESISLLDNIIFALSPLGVLTAVVSVIRVCGSSSLKAFIGRAQEGPAEAESELLPCVSQSTAELFNDGGISRVFGRPKIVEIVAWETEDPKTGERSVEFGTLRDALRKQAWSVKGSGLTSEDIDDPTHLPELDIPNLSLNKGIKRRGQPWFYCAAILGTIMQIGESIPKCHAVHSGNLTNLSLLQVSSSMLQSQYSYFLRIFKRMTKLWPVMRFHSTSWGHRCSSPECSFARLSLNVLRKNITLNQTSLVSFIGYSLEISMLAIRSSAHSWLQNRAQTHR